MGDGTVAGEGRLRIVHILRSPVGGLFRHVRDLAGGQAARGHLVGIIADSTTGGPHAEAALAALAPILSLGVARLPMRRDPHPYDAGAMAEVLRRLSDMRPGVVHGHGAKGALYARLPGLIPFADRTPLRVYTPHGGSLHFDARSAKGVLVLGMERILARYTDLMLFESSYAAERYAATLNAPPCPVRVVHNGLQPTEFVPVATAERASDFLYVGELRTLKGVDVFLRALGVVAGQLRRPVRATVVGDGPDRAAFEALSSELPDVAVTFTGILPARDAFALGRILVVPSRAESLPYIVLEAVAARVPLIASAVGGIPEIVGANASVLVPPDDVTALAATMRARVEMPPQRLAEEALALSRFVETRFAIDAMVDGVLAGYRDALVRRNDPLPSADRAIGQQPRFGR